MPVALAGRMLSTVTDQLEELGHAFLAALPRLGLSLLAILATWVAVKIVRHSIGRVSGKFDMRPSLSDLIRQLSGIVTWVIGLLIAAMIAFPSLTPGQLIGVVGLGSVAVGFAFKDIFENFFAGVLILWRFPFENDDIIECNGIEGTVRDVTVRMTLVRTLDGQLVALPNATLFKNAVTVRTAEDHRRVSIDCGVSFDSDIAESRKVIREAVEGCQTVEKDKPIQVFAKELGESSIDFVVRWWTGSRNLDVHRSRDEVVTAVKSALDAAGIEIPFPYRTLTFKSSDPLHMAANGNARSADRATTSSAN